MTEIQKIDKDLWYVCTRDEYTGDYPDGDLTFKEGHSYKGEDILKEYSEKEIQKYYLRSFRLWTVQDAKPGDFLTYSSEEFKAINFVDSECAFLSPDHKDLARSLLRCIYRALE